MPTYVDIGLAVAEADPSMGWITTFYMEHNWLLTMFAEDLQDEIFGAQPFVLAPGSVNPSGRAIPTGDGTYTLSGHWTFGTGICHADWVLRRAARSRATSRHAARNFLLPVDEVEVKDTWHVDGMAATGSRDIVVTDVVVPERRVSLMPPPHVFAKPGDPVPAPDPDRAVPLAHRRHAGDGRGQASPRAVRGPLVRPGHVRHQADAERPGADAGAPGQPARRGRLRRDADARRRRPHAGPRRRSSRPRPAGPAAPSPRRSRTSSAGAATSCARSCSRAVRRCTTSTTSCSASTATST